MLTISREEFRKIYHGLHQILADEEIFYTLPKTDTEVLNKCLPSKLWRLNNCYTIVDKFGTRIRFRMNKAQHKVYAASLHHPRLIILKSRQQGISTFWLVNFFDDAITRRDFSIGLMAQGQDEASTLLERTKILWDELDPNLKAILGVYTTSDNTKEFALNNGSKIFVRTSFRSTTLQRLHISEMGKIANKYPEKAKETKTGTLQAIAPGNIAVIESTAEGDNLFKTDYDNAAELDINDLTTKDFLAVFLSWVDDPDCFEPRLQLVSEKHAKYFAEIEAELNIKLTDGQKNFWIAKYRELGDKIFQEYPTTATEAFLATKDGAYYAKMYRENITARNREVAHDLYDPNLDVQAAVDLGMNDTNSILIGQTYMDEVRLFDEIYDSGEPIKYYTDIMKKRPWFPNLKTLILPHDADVRELTSGKTRREVFEEELPGVHIIVLEKIPVNDGIEIVRQMIQHVWISKKCTYIIGCFKNYKKEWDEKREKWKDKPEHDEYSNGGDCIRYFAIGRRKSMHGYNKTKKKQSGHDV